MHLVLVSSLLPVERPQSGFDIANKTLLDVLRMEGHRVSVLGYRSPGSRLAQSDAVVELGEMEVSNARVSGGRKLQWLLRAIASGTTVSSAKMLECGRQRVCAALEQLSPFDGLILNSVQLPGAFLSVFEPYPSIFVAHNVEAATALENARYATGAVGAWLFRREANHLSGLEKRLCDSARFVWTLAEEDRTALGLGTNDRSATLPMVTDVRPPMVRGERSPQFDIGLIGTWSWRPNRIGLDWFLREVVPLLPETFHIAVAGTLPDPPAQVHPGLQLIGRVPDARRFLADCAVIPLASTVGTGVPLKTIETFEMGLPAVATPNALRGIRTVPENCATASGANCFAEALQQAVAAVKRGDLHSLDGCIFHAEQMTGLKIAIRQGLECLS